MFIIVSLICATLWLLFTVAVTTARNMISAVIFKFLPLVIATMCVLSAYSLLS